MLLRLWNASVLDLRAHPVARHSFQAVAQRFEDRWTSGAFATNDQRFSSRTSRITSRMIFPSFHARSARHPILTVRGPSTLSCQCETCSAASSTPSLSNCNRFSAEPNSRSKSVSKLIKALKTFCCPAVLGSRSSLVRRCGKTRHTCAQKAQTPHRDQLLAIASFNAFSRVRLHPCLLREALRLRSRQHRLPYVIRHVRRPTQEHGEFAPVRLPRELFLRNGGMPPRPIRRRELRKPFPEPLADLVPCRLERLSRHRKFDGSIRFRNEHCVEFRVKPFANA